MRWCFVGNTTSLYSLPSHSKCGTLHLMFFSSPFVYVVFCAVCGWVWFHMCVWEKKYMILILTQSWCYHLVPVNLFTCSKLFFSAPRMFFKRIKNSQGVYLYKKTIKVSSLNIKYLFSLLYSIGQKGLQIVNLAWRHIHRVPILHDWNIIYMIQIVKVCLVMYSTLKSVKSFWINCYALLNSLVTPTRFWY